MDPQLNGEPARTLSARLARRPRRKQRWFTALAATNVHGTSRNLCARRKDLLASLFSLLLHTTLAQCSHQPASGPEGSDATVSSESRSRSSDSPPKFAIVYLSKLSTPCACQIKRSTCAIGASVRPLQATPQIACDDLHPTGHHLHRTIGYAVPISLVATKPQSRALRMSCLCPPQHAFGFASLYRSDRIQPYYYDTEGMEHIRVQPRD